MAWLLKVNFLIFTKIFVNFLLGQKRRPYSVRNSDRFSGAFHSYFGKIRLLRRVKTTKSFMRYMRFIYEMTGQFIGFGRDISSIWEKPHGKKLVETQTQSYYDC